MVRRPEGGGGGGGEEGKRLCCGGVVVGARVTPVVRGGVRLVINFIDEVVISMKLLLGSVVPSPAAEGV